MITVFILLAFTMALLGFMLSCIFKENQAITANFLLIAIISFISFVLYSNEPTAISVYQGKTTLEVTYKNGVPIDSVVVYKK